MWHSDITNSNSFKTDQDKKTRLMEEGPSSSAVELWREDWFSGESSLYTLNR